MLGGERLRRAFADVHKIAASTLSIVVVGETGTGKEAAAREVHRLSARSGRLVAVNCATIPAELAEAHLFGHIKGAFTGATSSEPGYFRSAEGGTLFLDEVAELPTSVQAKLLRVLQEGEFIPVGSTRPVKADVRIITATQRPLREAVQAGLFRQDLAARLDGFQVRLPPLRDRPEDVPALFRVFLEQALGRRGPDLLPLTVEQLCLYAWPNNVRELINVSQQVALLHGDEAVLVPRHLPVTMQLGSASGHPGPSPQDRTPTEAPSQHPEAANATLAQRFVEALALHHGNVRKAAEAVGISRTRAYRLVDKGQVDLKGARFGARARKHEADHG
jgi:transcriptional regulator with PAS, ATPase and Fis domain